MSLVDIKSILILSADENTVMLLKKIAKRLGAKKLLVCKRPAQAVAECEAHNGPMLVIEELKIVEKTDFFPVVQEKLSPGFYLPTPAFAILSPTTKGDIEKIEQSDYLGYDIKPLNESLIEQRIRDLFYQSYFYDESDALTEVIEKHLKNKNLKLALCELMPALKLNPNNESYLLLYAKILFERSKLQLAEKVIDHLLLIYSDNLSAKNIKAKILIAMDRYDEAESVQ
jgi:tetratricopeptide (TPR) repeat protein